MYIVLGLFAGEYEMMKWENDRFLISKKPTLFDTAIQAQQHIIQSADKYKSEGYKTRSLTDNYKIERYANH